MDNVSNLNSGQSYTVKKAVYKGNVEKMPFLEQSKELQKAGKLKAEAFSTVNDNGKVDILIEAPDGVAVISGKKVNLAELGRSAPEVALDLKQFDKNSDNYLEEHELKTSAKQRFSKAGIAIGASTVGAASTGAAIGGMGGTAVVPGFGTVVGAGGVGLLGGAIGFVSSFLWEGGKTVFWAMGDGYNTPEWVR